MKLLFAIEDDLLKDAVLVNAMKEQQAQIERQQHRIERQQQQLAALKALVCASHLGATACIQLAGRGRTLPIRQTILTLLVGQEIIPTDNCSL